MKKAMECPRLMGVHNGYFSEKEGGLSFKIKSIKKKKNCFHPISIIFNTKVLTKPHNWPLRSILTYGHVVRKVTVSTLGKLD